MGVWTWLAPSGRGMQVGLPGHVQGYRPGAITGNVLSPWKSLNKVDLIPGSIDPKPRLPSWLGLADPSNRRQ